MYDYPLFTAGNFIADYSTLEFYSLFKSPAEQSCAEIIVTGIAFCEKIKLVSKTMLITYLLLNLYGGSRIQFTERAIGLTITNLARFT